MERSEEKCNEGWLLSIILVRKYSKTIQLCNCSYVKTLREEIKSTSKAKVNLITLMLIVPILQKRLNQKDKEKVEKLRKL